jgi:hypothetical protein
MYLHNFAYRLDYCRKKVCGWALTPRRTVAKLVCAKAEDSL